MNSSFFHGPVSMVQPLVAVAATRTTVRGKTALCIASEKGFSEVVRCLLDAGADARVAEKWMAKGGWSMVYNITYITMVGHTWYISDIILISWFCYVLVVVGSSFPAIQGRSQFSRNFSGSQIPGDQFFCWRTWIYTWYIPGIYCLNMINIEGL